MAATKLFDKPADAVAFTASPDLSKTMDLVRTFLFDKGLLGYRVFLIQAADQPRFTGIQSLEQLRQLRFGQQREWSDVAVYQAAGLPVVTGSSYEGLFHMLMLRRFDAFGRGVSEVSGELAHWRKKYPQMAIETELLLYYPLPVYFWFARTDEGRLRGGALVATVMSNLGLERCLAAQGLELIRSKVGDRYVLEQLHERGWKLGGENSGHIICLDRHTTGDGIVSALQVLAALKQRGMSLADACADLVFYPQRLINVRMPAGFDWRADGGIASAQRHAEQALGASGRVLLRPSGTEPLLRVMVEGRDGALVDRLAREIAGAVEHAFA